MKTMKVQEEPQECERSMRTITRVVVVVVLAASVHRVRVNQDPHTSSTFSFMNHDGIFTMVRSNLKKKFRYFYHGTSVGAGSPKAKMRST
jgi:hypothetical protein